MLNLKSKFSSKFQCQNGTWPHFRKKNQIEWQKLPIFFEFCWCKAVCLLSIFPASLPAFLHLFRSETRESTRIDSRRREIAGKKERAKEICVRRKRPRSNAMPPKTARHKTLLFYIIPYKHYYPNILNYPWTSSVKKQLNFHISFFVIYYF